MTQQEIDRAVAVATGESQFVIHDRGFCIADPLDVAFGTRTAQAAHVGLGQHDTYIVARLIFELQASAIA